MKKGWEERFFEDCFRLKSGDNLTAKKMSENGNFPVFGGNGIAGYHNEYNLSGSNVIIGRVGALCGNVRHLTEKIWLTDNAFKIVDFKFDFDHKFLTYLLNYKDLRIYARQAAQPVISNSSLKDVVLWFPKSLSEQQRIVSILDEAFAAIDKAKANAEQNLKNARELFESYLQGVFEKKGEGWEEKTLGEIGNPKMCKRIFKDQTKSIGEIPFYKIGTFGKEPDAYISKHIYEEYRKQYPFPQKGDILISASGTIGRRVRYNGEPAYFQDSNIVWINNDEKQVLNDFLYEFYGACKWNSTKGATIFRLYNDNLKSIKIAFPRSKQEQQAIVRQLDALRAETQKMEAVYQQKIANLEELKKSILQKAFAGELPLGTITEHVEPVSQKTE